MASSTLAASAVRSSRRTLRSLLRIPAIRAAIISAIIYAVLPLLGEPVLTQLQLSTGMAIHPLILGAIYSILALVSGAGAALLPVLALFTRRGRRDFRVMLFVLVAPIVVACLFPTQYTALLELLHGYGL